jgi:hypothetical protein
MNYSLRANRPFSVLMVRLQPITGTATISVAVVSADGDAEEVVLGHTLFEMVSESPLLDSIYFDVVITTDT